MVRRFVAWWRGWRYHRSKDTRPGLEPVWPGEGDPRFGSMQLEEDWPGGNSCGFLPAEPPRLPDAGTREQMLAELSPEALSAPGVREPPVYRIPTLGRLCGPEQPQEWPAPVRAEHGPWSGGNENADRDAGFPQEPEAAASWGNSAGPGVWASSLAPGPDQMSESDWTAPPVAKPWPADTGASGSWGWALTGVHAPAPAAWQYKADNPAMLPDRVFLPRPGTPIRQYICPDPGHERLADTADIADAAMLAEVTGYMRDQDADVADWLAGRAVEWARLEIGALT